ncbi:MAG TPA: helix-turn-helix domain-containing protein [Puia sp.]|jgi:hypothetical protein
MTDEQNIQDQGGRPTKYRKEFTRIAWQLALLGATDAQIAEALDITPSTLYEWKNRIKGFSEALRRGKIIADAEVAAGLHKRATGFEYDEVTYERIELGDDEHQTPEGQEKPPIKIDLYKKKVITKYVPPDTGAAMGWLKNRQRDLWKDKQDIGIEFENMTDEQLDKIYNRVLEGALKAEKDGQA